MRFAIIIGNKTLNLYVTLPRVFVENTETRQTPPTPLRSGLARLHAEAKAAKVATKVLPKESEIPTRFVTVEIPVE